MGLGVGDEFRDGIGWNRRVDLHNKWHTTDARDRRKIVDHVEAEPEHCGVGGVCRRSQE
jgi:hypothetical protein